MDFETLIFLARNIDRNHTVLIVLLSAVSTHLLREILKPPMWIVIAAFPTLLVSAFLGNAALKLNAATLTSDPALDTVIVSVASMIICFAVGSVVFRGAVELRDDTKSGPYKPDRPDMPTTEN